MNSVSPLTTRVLTQTPPRLAEITIRRAGAGDAAAVERLAALDSQHAPSQPVLLADVDGDLRAAVSLRDGTVIADPFVDTRTVKSLLLTRAAQLRGDHVRRSRRFARPALRRPSFGA